MHVQVDAGDSIAEVRRLHDAKETNHRAYTLASCSKHPMDNWSCH